MSLSYDTFQTLLEKKNLSACQPEELTKQRDRKSSLSMKDQVLLCLLYSQNYGDYYR